MFDFGLEFVTRAAVGFRCGCSYDIRGRICSWWLCPVHEWEEQRCREAKAFFDDFA